MTDPDFKLDAERMMRAMHVASTDPARHYLKGVRIEPIDGGGVWMIATNGTIMLIQRDLGAHADHAATLAVTEPKCERIEFDDGTFCDRHIWNGRTIAVPALEDGQFVAAPTTFNETPCGRRVLIERIAGPFPDWRKVLGRPPKTDTSGLKAEVKTPAYLAIGTKAIEPLILARATFKLHDTLTDDSCQTLVTYPHDEESLGVLMKCITPYGECLPDKMLTAIGRGDLVALATEPGTT